ncbi:TPA: glycosyltransferase family 2 protein [Streptococcus suis]|nr:glycosyltransferase family 2 protein [Streptococcus suis]
MKNSDLVSIIVPVYNVQEYLRDCIRSILQQMYKNIEVLLVNDGSTDESGKNVSYISLEEPNIWQKHILKIASNLDIDSRVKMSYNLEQLGLDISIETEKLLKIYKESIIEKDTTFKMDV